MVNYSGILALPSILFKPGFILPHLSVKDIRYLDWKALKSIGINTVVFDKDNCLTKPLKDPILPQLENSLLDCIQTFGCRNVVILSNSSGSSDDPNSIGAESLSRNLLSNSKIQVMLHENKKPSSQCAQEVFDWYSENQKRSNESPSSSSHSKADEGLTRILFVGDRPTTDIITGHRISQVFRKRSPDVLKRRGLEDHQDACLTVLTTNLWEKEKLGTRFMRSLEYRMVRYLVGKGIEPGKSWKKEKRKGIEPDSNERSFSSSLKVKSLGSRVEKAGLGLVSDRNRWQFSGIVKSQLSKETKTSKNEEFKPSTDLAISNRDHSPEPKLSKLISSILPLSFQPFFKKLIRFTSIWPIRPMLDLMRDGWHLILRGSKIGIHSQGFFRDVSKRKREEELKEKIDEHVFLGWDSNQRIRGSIKRRRNNQLFSSESFASQDELMTRSHQRRGLSSSSSSSSSTSIYSVNSISKSNLRGLDSSSSFNLKKSSSSSTNPNRTFSTTKTLSSSSSTSKSSSSSPPNSNPSRLPSKNWLAAIAALFLIPACYLLGARLHEYREESMALTEEERIRKSNQGLNQDEIEEKSLREEREKEGRIKRGVEREREERIRSLELAHFHLSHEKKEVEEKLARLRERRVEEQRESDTSQTTGS